MLHISLRSETVSKKGNLCFGYLDQVWLTFNSNWFNQSRSLVQIDLPIRMNKEPRAGRKTRQTASCLVCSVKCRVHEITQLPQVCLFSGYLLQEKKWKVKQMFNRVVVVVSRLFMKVWDYATTQTGETRCLEQLVEKMWFNWWIL